MRSHPHCTARVHLMMSAQCEPQVPHFLTVSLVGQICGDYLLSKMDSQSAISFRNFASCMGDGRVLGKVDAYIQEHMLEVSEQEDFLKLPRLKVSPAGWGWQGVSG